MGSVVKEKVLEMEDNTREGICRRIRKDVVRCAQAVVGKKKLIVKF